MGSALSLLVTGFAGLGLAMLVASKVEGAPRFKRLIWEILYRVRDHSWRLIVTDYASEKNDR
jgi:hypothetical protein